MNAEWWFKLIEPPTAASFPQWTDGYANIDANARPVSESSATTTAASTARSAVCHLLSRAWSSFIYWYGGAIHFPRLVRHFQHRLLGDVHALNMFNSWWSNLSIIGNQFLIWFIDLYLSLYHNVHWCTVHNSRHFYSLVTSLLCSFHALVTTSRKIMQLNMCVKP